MTEQERAATDRLYSVFRAASKGLDLVATCQMAPTKAMESDLPIDRAWRAVGAELLRQMKWARAEVWTGTGPGVDAYDVTLAPPERTP